MDEVLKQSPVILIADDSEINRAILSDMLASEYTIVEATNGKEALERIQDMGSKLSLILLDIVMPEMDGFGVLEEMNRTSWIEDIPVIMISAESGAEPIERAYALGATDFISRPFDPLIVHKRVVNTILLYGKQKQLVSMVAEQLYEKEANSNLMIEVLGHIVEFRNGDSGPHIRHVHVLTELILKYLNRKGVTQLSDEEIALISCTSALHDVGKISIPEQILNKPGRLTPDEFRVIKTHTTIGAKMLQDLPMYKDQPLVRTAYEICRWHHERYDGRGYPDGLKGDEIPISAQVVALADVYDALTSPRVYKPAYSHEKAVQMILSGECGDFNPALIECLTEIGDVISAAVNQSVYIQSNHLSLQNVAASVFRNKDVSVSKRTLQLLEQERVRQDFFASLSHEIQFEFTLSPPKLTLTSLSAQMLGFPEEIGEPLQDARVTARMGRGPLYQLSDRLRSTSPSQPLVEMDCQITINGEPRWHRVMARATWSGDEPPVYQGCIGKAVDVHESHMRLADLERIATTDPLTGLFNRDYAKRQIRNRFRQRPEGRYALALLDMDGPEAAGDEKDPVFRDRLIVHLAQKLSKAVRGSDIVARVGSDAFLLFAEYTQDVQSVVGCAFPLLRGEFEGHAYSLSMGIAQPDVAGADYDKLFHAADNALYAARGEGGGQHRFYDPSMAAELSVITPIPESECKDGSPC